MARERLIVFARWTEPGVTKTRLVPALGAQGAAALQRRMTARTLHVAASLARRRGVDVEVRFAGGDEARMAGLFGPTHRYRAQGEGDLGARMARALAAAFDEGTESAVVVGTDCPGLEETLLTEAFDALRATDVVIGPAQDGGYTLIGSRGPWPGLFEGIPWGTAAVLSETERAVERLGLTATRLVALRDVDRPEDVEYAEAVLGDRVSVVVPARNEAPRIGAMLDVARRHGEAELVVVDGTSTDGTPEVARRHGARVVSSAPGRGVQMNAGARAAYGGVLIFCHADTHLPEAYEALAREALAKPGAAAGAFDLELRGEERQLRRVERAVHRRSRWRQMPYGDQALFLRRAVFERLGGYRELAIMEDYDLIRRARRLGRIVMAQGAVSTSARFWRERGLLRATLINQAVLWGWRLGVDPARLARWRR